MTHEEKDDKLTEADRTLLRLYDEAKEPIEWDESDDAILALSREIHEQDAATPAEKPAIGSGMPEPANDAEDTGNVVSIGSRRPSIVDRIIHSPAMGFSMAACLMIGVFAGQGMIGVVDLGVSPRYDEVVSDNARLQTELDNSRRELTRSLPVPGGPARPGTGSLMALTQAISGFDCSSLSATVSKDMQITITGYVGNAADLGRLTKNLSALDRTAKVLNQAIVRGWPSCEALDILHQKANFGADRGSLPIVQPFNHGPKFVEDEELVVEVKATTQYDGYLYVDFYQHDGTVVHMLPGPDMTNNAVKAGQRILLGSGVQKYTIAPPYGNEMLIVLSSPKPLFDKPRPQAESAKDYFDALRTALKKAEKQGFGKQILSNVDYITTGPK